MLLYLYNSKTTDFIFNGEPIRHAYNAEVIRKGSEFYLTFNLLIDDLKEYKSIRRGMIVRAKTPDGNQAFRVVSKKKYGDHIEVEAYHVFFDLANRVVGPVRINNIPLTSGLEIWKSAFKSGYAPFTFGTSMSTQNRTFNTEENEYNFNALDVLIGGKHSIVGTYEAELLINNFDVRLIEKVGKQTNALLYEHKNIADFEDEESDKELVTRIYLRSEYTPERIEGSTETPQPVVIESVVESPLINNYSQVYEAHYTNNDCKTKEELEQWGRYKFTYDKVDLPRRNIKVATNIIDGTVINFGDTLVLKYLLHDVDETIRCVGYKYDPIAEIYIEVELGSTSTTIGDVVSRHVVDTTKSYQNEIQKQIEQVTKIIMSANGYNRTAYGPDPVPNPIEGDSWYKFQFDNPNQVEVYRWDGTQWVLVLDDFTGARVKEAIAAVEAQAVTLEKEVQATDQKAVEALNKAGISTDLATNAKSIADQAKIDANKAISDILAIDNDIDARITPSVNKALTDASSALSQAQVNGGKITTLTSDVDKVKGELALKITSAQADELIKGKGYVTTTELNTKAGELSSNITRVEGLIPSGGGVNLYDKKDIYLYSSYKYMYRTSIIEVDPYFNIGDDITISFDIDAPNGITKLNVYDTNENQAWSIGNKSIAVPTGKSRQSITYKVVAGKNYTGRTHSLDFYNNNDGNPFTITNIKIEKGKVATPHSLSTSDQLKVAKDLEVTNTHLTQTDKDIQAVATRVTTAEGNVSKAQADIKINADEITKLLTRTLTNETTINNTKITAEGTKTELTKLQGDFSNFGGGVNLYDKKEIAPYSTLKYMYRTTIDEVDEHFSIGDDITISFDITADDVIPKFRAYDENSSKALKFGYLWFYNVPKGKSRLSKTAKLVAGQGKSIHCLDFYNDEVGINYKIENLKIEKGKVATPYSASYKDQLSLQDFTAFKGEYERTNSSYSARLTTMENTVGDATKGLVLKTNTTTDTVNKHEKTLYEAGTGLVEKVNTVISTVNIHERTISEIDTISTTVTQISNAWGVKIKSADEVVTAINATTSGVRLKGKVIYLDGDTYITNGIIKDAHIDTLSANKLTAGTIDASKISVINLDVNSLSSNKATFIQALFNGMHSILRITGDKISINRTDGSLSSAFTDLGLEFFQNGYRRGFIMSTGAKNGYPAGTGFVAERGSALFLGSNYNASTGIFTPTVVVDGSTDKVTINGYDVTSLLKVLFNLSNAIKGAGGALYLPASFNEYGGAATYMTLTL